MTNIDLSRYQSIARSNAKAEILVDRNSGDLRVRGGSLFNRAVCWVRERIQDRRLSPSERAVMRQAERQAAHNSFIRAIGTSTRFRYEAGEIEGVTNGLASDALHNVPLSARRVREVFSALNDLCPETVAENRGLAAWVSGRSAESRDLERRLDRELADRPLLQEAEFRLSDDQQATLSKRIYEAVVAASDPERKMAFGEADAIAHQVTAEFLDEREQAWLHLREEFSQMAGIDVEGLNAEPARASAAATGPREAGRQTAEAAPAAPGRHSAGFFARLTAGRRTGASAAHKAEKGSANWIVRNRLDRWYREALGGAARSNKNVKAPDPLANRIRQQLAGHGGTDTGRPVGDYERVKIRGRAIVAEFVREHDAGSLHRELAGAKLPRDVETHARSLMSKGAVHSRGALAKAVNERLADWVVKNRLGQWCFEALDRLKIRSGKQVSAPGQLVGAVSDAISQRDEMANYPEVKAESRRLIRDYVAEHPDQFRSRTK